MPDPLYLAWWNLENLFDTERARRSEKLKRALGGELRGWTTEVLRRKVANLAEVTRPPAALRQSLRGDPRLRPGVRAPVIVHSRCRAQTGPRPFRGQPVRPGEK